MSRGSWLLIPAKILIIGLCVINLSTGSPARLQAVGPMLGGSYTLPFRLGFLVLGLLAPLLVLAGAGAGAGGQRGWSQERRGLLNCRHPGLTAEAQQ